MSRGVVVLKQDCHPPISHMLLFCPSAVVHVVNGSEVMCQAYWVPRSGGEGGAFL